MVFLDRVVFPEGVVLDRFHSIIASGILKVRTGGFHTILTLQLKLCEKALALHDQQPAWDHVSYSVKWSLQKGLTVLNNLVKASWHAPQLMVYL